MAAAPRALRINSRGLSALFRQNKYVTAPFSSSAFAQVRLLQTRQAKSTIHAAVRLPHTTRWYGSAEGAGMTEGDLTNRVINVVKMFDKVTPDKVTAEAHFVKDLGLDSLDAVEIVMAFEDEFGVEISDEEAEKILSCQDAINLLKVKMDISSSS